MQLRQLFPKPCNKGLGCMKSFIKQYSIAREEQPLQSYCDWKKITLPISKLQLEILEGKDVDYFLNKAIDEGLPDPYGVITWSSSFTTANLFDLTIKSSSSTWENRKVCDVGCGTGLSSIVAEFHGADVTSMDYNSHSLELVRLASIHNRKLHPNRPYFKDVIDVIHFDLQQNIPLPDADVYIFSDIMYFDDLAKICAERVIEVISKGNEAIVTDPGRLTRKVFMENLSKLSNGNDIHVQEYEHNAFKTKRFTFKFDSLSNISSNSHSGEVMEGNEEQGYIWFMRNERQ